MDRNKNQEANAPTAPDTLANRIDTGTRLTHEEAGMMAEFLGKGCWAKTKLKLYTVLSGGLDRLESCGRFRRVFISPRPKYLAGQDYKSEIRWVRQQILKVA
jgi:hypothetical protein